MLSTPCLLQTERVLERIPVWLWLAQDNPTCATSSLWTLTNVTPSPETWIFRYGKGTDYNGLVIKNVRVFENAGVNILGTASSGFPYSRRVRAYGLTETASPIVGVLNGSAQTLAVQN